MAAEIHTPFPSIRTVAKAVGVPMKRAREIERLVSDTEDAARNRRNSWRRPAKANGNGRRSGRR